MTIPFQCEHCQKSLQVNDSLGGKKVKCPGCQTVLTVPQPVVAATVAGSGPASAPNPAAPPAPKGSAPNGVAPSPPAGGVKPPVPAVKPGAAAPVAKPPAVAKPPISKPPAPAVKAPAAPTPVAPVAAAKPPVAPPAAVKPPVETPRPPAKAAEVAKVPPVAKPRAPAAPSAARPPAPTTGDSAAGTTKVPDAIKAALRPPVAPKPPAPKLPDAPAGKSSDSAPGTAKVPDAIKAGLKPKAADGIKKAAPFKAPPKKPANGDGTPPVDADELAASLLFEDEKKPEPEDPVAIGKPVKAECFFCGEAGEYPAELAGKQAPCAFCKRIIKIPLPVSDKPKDWRDVEKRPSGAKRNLEELDDAWGTDVRATVTQETLVETGAIVIKAPKEPLVKRVKRWVYIAAIIAIVVTLGWYGWKKRNTTQQFNAIDAALKALEKDRKGPKLIPSEAAAEIHRSAGEFYLREDQPDFERVDAQFKQAQGLLRDARPGIERDLGLLELGLSITDTGGTAEQVADRVRRKPQDMRESAMKSLQQIKSPEVRADAARRITHRLLGRAESAEERETLSREAELLVLAMGGNAVEKPELLARIGLELFLAGEKASAQRVADKGLQLYQGTPPPPVSPTLVALLIALGKQKEANELAAPPAAQGVFPAEARVGHAMGLVLTQDNWKDARDLALFPGGGEEVDRLQTLLALADLALAKNKPDEAAGLIGEAAKRVGQPRVTPWMRFLLVRTGARAGKAAEMRELAKTVFAGKDSVALLNRAQVEVLRGDLLNRAGQPAAAEMQAEAEKKEQAFPPALVLLARHNARYGSGARSEVERWEPESLRALGLAGVALGMKDHSADAPTEAAKK